MKEDYRKSQDRVTDVVVTAIWNLGKFMKVPLYESLLIA